MLPPVVETERLVLPLWTADEVADIRSGRRRPGWHPDFPREDDGDAATMHTPGDVWGPRSIVRGSTVLGSIGFFGPPTPAADGVLETEVGYGLVAEARGWGFATEALRALLALTDAAGVRIRASVEPGNRPSIRVLAKTGFTELRGSDEEGHLVMARPLPGHAPGTSVRDRLRAEVGAAMRARDRDALATYRTALAAIDNAGAVPLTDDHRAGAVEAAVGPGAAEVDRRELGDAQTREVVEHEIAELLAAAEVAPAARAEELREAAALLRRVIG